MCVFFSGNWVFNDTKLTRQRPNLRAYVCLCLLYRAIIGRVMIDVKAYKRFVIGGKRRFPGSSHSTNDEKSRRSFNFKYTNIETHPTAVHGRLLIAAGT